MTLSLVFLASIAIKEPPSKNKDLPSFVSLKHPSQFWTTHFFKAPKSSIRSIRSPPPTQTLKIGPLREPPFLQVESKLPPPLHPKPSKLCLHKSNCKYNCLASLVQLFLPKNTSPPWPLSGLTTPRPRSFTTNIHQPPLEFQIRPSSYQLRQTEQSHVRIWEMLSEK